MYELMRPKKGIVNLASLKIMFACLFEEVEYARDPCKSFTHPICTVVFSATF